MERGNEPWIKKVDFWKGKNAIIHGDTQGANGEWNKLRIESLVGNTNNDRNYIELYTERNNCLRLVLNVQFQCILPHYERA